MSPEPTGRIIRTESGRDLILNRDLPVSLGEAWAWISDSGKLENWFGTWTGSGEPGGQVKVTMNAEAEEATSDAVIIACDPGHSYEVKVTDEYGGWLLELRVEEKDPGSSLEFIHHLDDETGVGSVGAGWEYYLDRLQAAIDEKPMPDFDEYWPAMGPYYENQI